jgi:hypothetical protein
VRFGSETIEGCTLEEAWIICHVLDVLGDRDRDVARATYELRAWRRQG